LPSKAHIAALLAGEGKTALIAEIEMNAIQNIVAMGAGHSRGLSRNSWKFIIGLIHFHDQLYHRISIL